MGGALAAAQHRGHVRHILAHPQSPRHNGGGGRARGVRATGDAAVSYDTALIKRQRTQEALGRKMNEIVTKGRTSVRFNPQYQPAKKPAAPAAASGPAAPATAGR